MRRCDTGSTRGSGRELPPERPVPDACEGRRVPPGLTAAAHAAEDRDAFTGVPPDQVTQDRSGPPTAQCSLLLSVQERWRSFRLR
jgi:hypothetical protein